MSGLLSMANGMLAILNEQRQVVACNYELLKMVGVSNPREAFGLRPGEIIGCVNANETSGGCGTTKWCSTCGAVLAILTSLRENKPAEKVCALSVVKADEQMDLAFQVQSRPIDVNGQRFVLVYIRDITLQEQRAALERFFFHDLNNLLAGLSLSSLLLMEDYSPEIAQSLRFTSRRLINEVAIQRIISKSDSLSFEPSWEETTPRQIITELRSLIKTHPAAENKRLHCRAKGLDLPIKTDSSVLFRVLLNMILNAFEATEENGTVRIWVEQQKCGLDFCVWNAQHIPEDISRRIFQRNFSTKQQEGRGFGTYSIKHFGEEVLGGKVSFETSSENGTTFRLSLPLFESGEKSR